MIAQPPAFGPERQFGDVRDVEVVRAIEVADRSVEIVQLRNIDAQRTVAVCIARKARRFGQGVVDGELDAVGEASFESRLQRIVLAVANRRDQPRLTGAAEPLVQLAAGLPAVDRRPIQLEKTELIDLARPDVRRLGDEAPPKLFLYGSVPRPDVAAVELIGQGEHGQRARHRDAAVPQIGVGNRRDSIREPAREGEGVRPLDQQVQHRRVVGAQRSRQRVGIVGDAESRSQNHPVVDPVRRAQPWREQRLADLHAQVLGHRSHAADQHLIGVHVVALEAAVGAGGNRKVLPARAVRQRHL